MDAGTGQIVAAALTTKDVDDGSQVGPLLGQVTALVASFTADGAYDQEGVSAAVAVAASAPAATGRSRCASPSSVRFAERIVRSHSAMAASNAA